MHSLSHIILTFMTVCTISCSLLRSRNELAISIAILISLTPHDVSRLYNSLICADALTCQQLISHGRIKSLNCWAKEMKTTGLDFNNIVAFIKSFPGSLVYVPVMNVYGLPGDWYLYSRDDFHVTWPDVLTSPTKTISWAGVCLQHWYW